MTMHLAIVNIAPTVHKKILKITIALAIFATNFAYGQQKKGATTTIDAADLNKQGAIKGKDIVINDASLNKYVGTWIWSDGANSFKINFVKQTHHYGADGNTLDLDILTGSYEFSKNGKLITVDSDKDFSGSSGGKTDTVNLFITIKSRKSQVALLAIYLPDHTLRLEIEKNRFEFKNDKDFELPTPIILTKQ